MSKRMKEFRAMHESQLTERLSQLKMELVKFNTQVATGTAPKSPGLIRQAKRNVARILTILSSKKEAPKAEQIQASAAAPSTDKSKKTVTITGDNAKSDKKKEELKKE